ncbi:hypothetical protein BS17DRAFT_123212 [Gyrodon lividus]|nr:hypothetical protein BS17DRAFT_123212 [Gyrodon lividus]
MALSYLRRGLRHSQQQNMRILAAKCTGVSRLLPLVEQGSGAFRLSDSDAWATWLRHWKFLLIFDRCLDVKLSSFKLKSSVHCQLRSDVPCTAISSIQFRRTLVRWFVTMYHYSVILELTAWIALS